MDREDLYGCHGCLVVGGVAGERGNLGRYLLRPYSAKGSRATKKTLFLRLPYVGGKGEEDVCGHFFRFEFFFLVI